MRNQFANGAAPKAMRPITEPLPNKAREFTAYYLK